jgi:MFS transporter, DHA1 family, multidrug resistance protein
LFGLSIAAFLAPFTQTIYTPSLPEIGDFFKVNTFFVNLTISIFTFILATSQFMIGPLTDTKGRKAVLLPGLMLFMAGSLICLLSTNYFIFLFGRAIQAFGISTGSVVAAAMIGDIYSPKDRGSAMSIYQTMVFLGPVLGPVFGSFVAGYADWQWSFIILVVASFFIYIYNRIVLQETLPKDATPTIITFNTFKKIIVNPSSFSIMLLGFTQFYGYYIFLVFLPSLVDTLYQLPVATKGLFYLPLTVGLVLGSFAGARLQQTMTRKLILITSSYGISFIVLIFWLGLLSHLLLIPILMLLLLSYGILLGVSLPAQTTSLINLYQEEKGTAIGAYNFLRFTGSAIGPLLGAVIYNVGGDFALYLSLSIFLFISAFVLQKNIYDPYEMSNKVDLHA